MTVASSPAAFAAAVDEYVFADVELDVAGLAPGCAPRGGWSS